MFSGHEQGDKTLTSRVGDLWLLTSHLVVVKVMSQRSPFIYHLISHTTKYKETLKTYNTILHEFPIHNPNKNHNDVSLQLLETKQTDMFVTLWLVSRKNLYNLLKRKTPKHNTQGTVTIAK